MLRKKAVRNQIIQKSPKHGTKNGFLFGWEPQPLPTFYSIFLFLPFYQFVGKIMRIRFIVPGECEELDLRWSPWS